MSGAAMTPAHALRALVEQLDVSQWAPADAIAASQFRHLARLADYCARHAPALARRLAAAGVAPADLGTPDGFRRVPVMTRRDVQAAGAELHCRRVPHSHRPVVEATTSGSTGEPVLVRRTAVSALFAQAMAMRELRWHERDLSGRLCLVRPNIPTLSRRDDWGPPATLFGPTGPLLAVPITIDIATLAERICEFAPTLLVIYPSTLRAFTAYAAESGMRLPGLAQVLTIGETLSDAVRAEAEMVFDAAVSDCYSSEECGAIAMQCPVSGLYHVMSESLLVEVLDADGRPCAPGEIGRVTITDLHNYATPLIRYDVGDYAEVAPACPCGRGLPAWTRIVGRERNLVLMPDGRRHWPLTGFPRVRDVAPVAQYQFVQESREDVELRLVVERTLTHGEEDGLKRLFCDTVGHPFAVRLRYFDRRIPPAPSGKFEEFVCHVDEH